VPFSPAIRKGVRLTFFIVYSLEPDIRERAITDLTRMLREDCLIHNIAARLPLEKIAEAHDLVERGGVSGNVILQVE
jgi:NADPH2:quinone reductase